MNNIRLYLYDQFGNDATKEYEVELDSTIQFAITKQFTDLENPTTIINDWSKSIAIPFTKHNNEIFNHLYRSDRIVTANTPVGAFGFDPTKKIPFRLINDENVLMTGYVKVLSVEQTSSVAGKYNITLNGELGKIFQELKNITFNRSESTSDYYIDGSQYVFEEMNKDLIKTCWTTDGQSTMTLMKRTDVDYKVTDIIGFAPNNAFCDDFDYKSFEDPQHEIRTLASVLDTKWAADAPNIGVKADSVIPDGLTSRGLGEFRSYQQIPYIYWNKLWKIFEEKATSLPNLDEWTFDLDPVWFNSMNPYWGKLIYCLDKPQAATSTKITWDGTLYPSEGHIIFPGTVPDTNRHNRVLEPLIPGYTFIGTDIWDEDNDYFNLKTDYNGTRDFYCKVQDYSTLTCDISFNYSGQVTPSDARISTNQALYVIYQFRDVDTSRTVQTIPFVLCNANFSPLSPDYIKITEYETNIVNNIVTMSFATNIGQYFKPMYPEFMGEKLKVEIRCYWATDEVPMISYYYDERHPTDVSVTFKNDLHIINNTDFKSFMTFDLNDLWNKEYNIFEQILNYCKMFRIYIEADNINKKLIFRQSDQFFNNNTFQNWSDKVDYSKPWKLEPNIMESQYLLLNYDDKNETELEKHYREVYNLRYGEKKHELDYSFNNDTKNLFGKIKLPNVFSPSILSWYVLHDLNIITYTGVNEIYINNEGEDNKELSCFGEMFFYKGLKEFEDESTMMRLVQITDDTEKQIKLSTYTFNQVINHLDPEDIDPAKHPIKTYPNLGFNLLTTNEEYASRPIDTSKISVLFGEPSEWYYRETAAVNNKYLYDIFWKNYLNTLYNIQTKRITCYLRLTADDYKQFNFNRFVIIENQLYMVNKIFDYDVNSAESTKVELISINDLEDFTKTQYNIAFINPLNITKDFNSRFSQTSFSHYEWCAKTPNLITWEWDTLRTTIPDTWVKDVEIIGGRNLNNREIKVTIIPNVLIEYAGSWTYVLKVTASSTVTYVSGTINVIRDTDMAQEMTV